MTTTKKSKKISVLLLAALLAVFSFSVGAAVGVDNSHADTDLPVDHVDLIDDDGPDGSDGMLDLNMSEPRQDAEPAIPGIEQLFMDIMPLNTGSLNNQFGLWHGNGNAEITVNWTGWYRITVTGGSGGDARGGNLTGLIQLKQGDVLRAQVIVGGTGGNASAWWGAHSGHAGASAMIIYVNEVAILGAGGAAGANGTRIFGPSPSTAVASNGSTSRIDNSMFSSGGGGTGRVILIGDSNLSESRAGNPGNTIPGSMAAAPAQPGQNFLNTSLVSLVSQPNNSTVVSFRVEAVQMTETDTFESIVLQAEYIKNMAESLRLIAAGASNESKAIAVTPPITVVAGHPFDIWTVGDPATTGGTHQGITVINNNPETHYLNIIGVVPDVGTKEIMIDNIMYVFKAISEPNSANVNVILH